MLLILLVGLVAGIVFGQSANPAIPSGAVLQSLIHRSFVNVDMDNDTFIEYYEFDTLIIVADTNNDGCMSKTEYEGFSAAPPAIADKLFDKFDPQGNNCITVDAISSEFSKMDTDGNHQVTEKEFAKYYVTLLHEVLDGNSTSTAKPTVITA